MVPQPDKWEQWWETGKSLNGTVALTGSNDNGSFRLSIGRLTQDGIVYNNNYYRNNFRLNSTYNFTDKLSVDATGEYIKSGSDSRGYKVPPGAGDQPGEYSDPFGFMDMLHSGFMDPAMSNLPVYTLDLQMTLFQPVGGMDRIPYMYPNYDYLEKKEC